MSEIQLSMSAMRRLAVESIVALKEGTPWPDEVSMLVDEIETQIPRLHAAGSQQSVPVDLALADLLESIGPFGGTCAARLRDPGSARTGPSVWSATPSGFSPAWKALARSLWADRVRARTVAPEGVAALSLVVLGHIRESFWLPGRRLVGSSVTSAAGEMVSQVVPSSPERLPDLSDILPATATVLGHRLLRYLVHLGNRRYRDDRVRSPEVVEIPGGVPGLADLLAADDHAAATIRACLECGQHVGLLLPGAESPVPLLRYWEDGRRLRIRLLPLLLPRRLARPTTRGERVGRRLVPIPLHLPPLVGRRRDHAAQAALQIEVLAEMRVRSPELAAGGVPISASRWRELAASCGVPLVSLPAILAAWSSGPEAFITTDGGGRYSLGSTYSRELAFMRSAVEQAGRRGRVGRRAS